MRARVEKVDFLGWNKSGVSLYIFVNPYHKIPTELFSVGISSPICAFKEGEIQYFNILEYTVTR